MKKRDEMTREEIGKRMDELARQYAETHEEQAKAELAELSHRLAELLRAGSSGRAPGKPVSRGS